MEEIVLIFMPLTLHYEKQKRVAVETAYNCLKSSKNPVSNMCLYLVRLSRWGLRTTNLLYSFLILYEFQEVAEKGTALMYLCYECVTVISV